MNDLNDDISSCADAFSDSVMFEAGIIFPADRFFCLPGILFPSECEFLPICFSY
jgi:hypothetical protein